MLNFTDHIKRIVYLADQTLKHTQEEKFDSARDDLNNISIIVNESMRQLHSLQRSGAGCPAADYLGPGTAGGPRAAGPGAAKPLTQ